MKPATVTAADIRETLAMIASAAQTPGHHLRYAALGHFADRILTLVKDHRRLEKQVAKLKTRN